MAKKITRKLAASLVTLGLSSILVLPLVTSALTATNNYGLDTNFNNVAIGQTSDLKGSIAKIINIILGFLGVIAVIIILAGGFKWMTAGGNEDKVGEARKMIIQGVIGLVIIFAAWAIASFVINQLSTQIT